MNFSADGQNKTTINLDDIKLKDVVKEVVREELKDDLNKMKEQQNQHLQEGNMYLNE